MGTRRHLSPRPFSRFTAGIILVGLAGAGALLGPTAAVAQDSVLEVSSDGASYSRSMADLFGPRTLVPRDQVDGSFWVRNSGADPAVLTVQAVDVVVGDPVLAGALRLSAKPASGVGEELQLVTDTGCRTLSTGYNIMPGETVPIAVRLAVGDLVGTEGQNAHVGFSLRVMLSEREVTEVGATRCLDLGGEGGVTPPTGEEAGKPTVTRPYEEPAITGAQGLGLIVVSAVAAIAGWLFILAGRRRRQESTREESPHSNKCEA